MLALVNGRVTTVEHSNPEASAVLIQDGKIAELRWDGVRLAASARRSGS
jgi:predicted amidohydrolase YtcJ